MTIRLYDSREQAFRELKPLCPGRVSMYVCGPTVQSSPHIGHLRSALVYDIMRSWFEYRGHTVTVVRNVTDIDDKILNIASSNQLAGNTEEWWALAYRVEEEFRAAYAGIGVRPPSYEPRATGSIPQIIELIEQLIERGYAYPAEDKSGDVYFDTVAWTNYGSFTRQSRENMEASPDTDSRAKRDLRDFALWKGAKSNEPASATWPSPWGAGRPGWHIECSAMATRYLGSAFDIHGGGLDLRFPHHENEYAQSLASGQDFATLWIHNGLVNVDGQKMSKSLGNSIYVSELFSQVSPLVARYFLGSAHYRSTLDYSAKALGDAEAAIDRITTFMIRAGRQLGAAAVDSSTAPLVPELFAAALDDDLNVPKALAVLHETIRAGNNALDRGDADSEGMTEASRHLDSVSAMLRVLGIDPREPNFTVTNRSQSEGLHDALDQIVTQMLDDRRSARENRDFGAADSIRNRLMAAGITVEDSGSGSHWSITP